MTEQLDALGRYSGPATLILSSLAGGAKHGYALMQDIEEFAGVTLRPGTLYGALSRLEGMGLIESLAGRRPSPPLPPHAAGRRRARRAALGTAPRGRRGAPTTFEGMGDVMKRSWLIWEIVAWTVFFPVALVLAAAPQARLRLRRRRRARVAALLRWYPEAWRERHGDGLGELLRDTIEDDRDGLRVSLDVAREGTLERMHAFDPHRAVAVGAC